jgi:hypothetical protein
VAIQVLYYSKGITSLINIIPLHSYVLTVTNKRLLIFESCGDSNQCTPYKGKLDTYDMYASPRQCTYVTHTLPAGSPHTWQPFTLTQQSCTDSLSAYHITLTALPNWQSSAFHLRALSDLRLTNQPLSIGLKREQTLNLTSGTLHSTSIVT